MATGLFFSIVGVAVVIVGILVIVFRVRVTAFNDWGRSWWRARLGITYRNPVYLAVISGSCAITIGLLFVAVGLSRLA